MNPRSYPSRSFRRGGASSGPAHLAALGVLMAAGAVFAVAMSFASPAEALTPAANKCRAGIARAARMGASMVLSARVRCGRRKVYGEIAPTVDCAEYPASLGGAGTGDVGIDRRLERLDRLKTQAGNRAVRRCDTQDILTDVDPKDVLDPASTCGNFLQWPDAIACAVDLGAAAADRVFTLLDVDFLGAQEKVCYGAMGLKARKTMFALNLWRAKCFEKDEALSPGGGTYSCDANISPPGAFNTTLFLRADKRLEEPMEELGRLLRTRCDTDLQALGLDLTFPEHTGGGFVGRITVDDLFDSLNDFIHGEVTSLMAELFPVGNYCGDGVQGGTEECDDGNHISDDGCDRDCTLPACGNGAVDGINTGAEECDDGNLVNEDGCDQNCILELCGNGEINPGWEEICDDGGESPTCDDDCTPAQCGDENVNEASGEQCDNGVLNSNLPDACRDGSGIGGACQLPACLDGVTDTGEECDGGGATPSGETVSCDLDCTNAFCGDGTTNVTRGEACDDGDTSDADSCPSGVLGGCVAVATCGDGIVCSDAATCDTGPGAATEECDGDGAGSGGQTPTCDTDCSVAICGDGTLNVQNVTPPATASGEACDDGNVLDGDGCDGNCTVTACGNGIVTSGEFCDDGNLTNGDGCDDAPSGNCTPTACGNGIVTPGTGETCDDSGESATCDADCTAAVCQDGVLNVTSGESCDGGGETALCDTDCTFAVCGDGLVNATSGEACDDSGESATCDVDCSAVACGDGTLNTSAGEQCDDGNTVSGDGCSAACVIE